MTIFGVSWGSLGITKTPIEMYNIPQEGYDFNRYLQIKLESCVELREKILAYISKKLKDHKQVI